MRQCQKGIEMCALYKKKDEKRDTHKKGGVMRSYFTHVASLAPTTKWLRRWLLCMTTTLSVCAILLAFWVRVQRCAFFFIARFDDTDFEREAKKKKKTKTKTKEGTV